MKCQNFKSKTTYTKLVALNIQSFKEKVRCRCQEEIYTYVSATCRNGVMVSINSCINFTRRHAHHRNFLPHVICWWHNIYKRLRKCTLMARPSMHGIAWWRCFEFRAHITIARRVATMKARRCVVWFQNRYSDLPGTSIKHSSACKYLVILLASMCGKFLGTSLSLPLDEEEEMLFNSAGVSSIAFTSTAAAINLVEKHSIRRRN